MPRTSARFPHAGTSRSRSHAPRPRSRISPAASSRASRCASRGCAGRCRATCTRSRDARCARARRGKYLLVDCGDGHLILHLGMSGSLRVLPAGHAGAASTITSTCSSATGFCGCAIRAASARCCGRARDVDAHPLLAHLGIEPLSRALDAGAACTQLTRAHRTGDQAVPDGRPAHRRRRQHLREREPVPRGHRSAHAGRNSFRSRDAQGSSAAIKHTLRAAIRAGGSSLRDFVGADGNAGYFQQRYWVYDRAGKPCRRCGSADPQASMQGQRSTFFCPACQK